MDLAHRAQYGVDKGMRDCIGRPYVVENDPQVGAYPLWLRLARDEFGMDVSDAFRPSTEVDDGFEIVFMSVNPFVTVDKGQQIKTEIKDEEEDDEEG
jgi:hypothetical protein